MSTTKMRLVDWLDDLCVRFIINLPREELESVERICFQIEEAQWFYEDFIRPLDPTLPSMNLKKFSLLMFRHCPLLSQFAPDLHLAAYSEFLAYKTRVPVRGAIMLNNPMDEVVLVKGWKKGARWGFPRGKINKDEPDLDCAIREVYEETGFDLKGAGLVKDEAEMKYIDVTMREQHMRLYVFRGVPMDAHFEPQTRKEISKVQWHKLSELPTLRRKAQHQGNSESLVKENMFYMVAPFLGPLKNWIKQQHKKDRLATRRESFAAPVPANADDTTADEGPIAAEELTADEGPSGAVHREKANDGHIHRLLATLRRSQQASEDGNLPEVSSAPEPVPDPASELKRLLSVGHPHRQRTEPLLSEQAMSRIPAPPSQVQPQSSVLLDLLRISSGVAFQPPSHGELPPRTPMEQITAAPAMPRSPHHHHPLARPFSSLPPPPSFPFSPAHQRQPSHPHQATAAHRQQPSLGQQSPSRQGGPPAQRDFFQPNPAQLSHPPQSQYSMRGPPMSMRHPGPPRFGPPPVPPSSQTTPRPYRHTGDPQFAPVRGFPHGYGPAVPPASKLPPPKLTPHALSLLNTFKSGGKPALSTATNKPSVQEAAETYSSARAEEGISIAPKPPVPAPIPSPKGMPSTQGLVPATSPPVASLFPATQSSISPTVAEAKTAHQAALLNLFRSGSMSGSTQTAPPSARDLVPELVELSAHPSPGAQREAAPPPPIKKLPPYPTSPLELLKSVPQPPGLTSATVSGPLNVPDFDAIRRNAQPAEMNGRATTPKHQESAPISILTKPVPPMIIQQRSLTSSPVPIHSVSPKTDLHAPKPKPFQPTILRRPSQNLPTTSPSLAIQFDRRDSLPSEQKNVLLGLFQKPAAGGTATSSPHLLASGLISPVSPLPGHRSRQGTPADKAPRSRISSLTSAPGNLEMPLPPAPTSVPVSATSGTGGYGTVSLEPLLGKMTLQPPKPMVGTERSPVTPIEKSFLLGFLEEVAKSAAKPRQGQV